ncbi:MAG: CAP domain-containing protein [Gemmobacter sp.]
MRHRLVLCLIAAVALSACEAPELGPDGGPTTRGYRLSDAAAATVQLRMLDSVNALRRSRGVAPVALDAALTASAATHARDMSVQNRPWHFGSDGSSPVSRAARAGYAGRLLGEVLSETYETELQTLAAWMERPDTRDVILNPEARDMGFAFYQEPNGKIWWVLNTGIRGFAGPTS